MASRIQGITVEIGGDTTKLQNALKGVNGQIKSTQSQLKDVNKLLKLDPGNTELLAQKHKLLAEAVSETKEKLATLKTAAEQANTALANGEISKEQYDALQREIVETEQDLKNLETQANQSATAVQKIAATGEKFKTVGDNISSAGQKLLPVTAGVTALGTASVTTAANFESSMSQVQATMGITKDSMSKVNGQSVNTMDTLSKLAKKMGADAAVNTAKEDLMTVMKEQGLVEGFDVGLEMSGSGAALKQMISVMRNGGKISLLGLANGPFQMDMNEVIGKGLTLQGIYGRKMDNWHQMIYMVQGGLDLKPAITHRFHYTEFEKGFEAMHSGKSGKVILDWTTKK